MNFRDDVIVIGAGVIGLSTAIRLAQSGLKVRVRTADQPDRTTSANAGAIWGPFLSEDPRVAQWSFATLDELQTLSERSDDTGIRLIMGVEASKDPGEIPHWFKELPRSRVCRDDELPRGYLWGWRYEAPTIDMPVYMRYLEQRFLALRGVIERAPVASLREIAGAPVIINCTGLASRELASDASMEGLFGRLVVTTNPGIAEFFAEFGEHDEVTYFMPQGPQMVLGGTIEPHHDLSRPDDEVVRAIVDRCAEINPAIREATILNVRGGFRPYRRTVRLEHIRDGARHLIHNYGHGGSGVSISWACADEVTSIVANL